MMMCQILYYYNLSAGGTSATISCQYQYLVSSTCILESIATELVNYFCLSD